MFNGSYRIRPWNLVIYNALLLTPMISSSFDFLLQLELENFYFYQWKMSISVFKLFYSHNMRVKESDMGFRVCEWSSGENQFSPVTWLSFLKTTSVQKSKKNDFFMARVKNSNCLNFCTQVDPIKTRKAVYFFSQICFYFREKRTFRFHPLESMNRVITGRKLNTFARLLRLGKSNQRELFHRLFVFCKM